MQLSKLSGSAVSETLGEKYDSGIHVLLVPSTSSQWDGILILAGRVFKRSDSDPGMMIQMAEKQFGELDSMEIFRSRDEAARQHPGFYI